MQNGKTILLADDDPLLVKLYQTKLEKAGFAVLVARDGEEALSLVKTSKPDLILLDIIMPKITGIGVLQRLKADPQTKNIPVLVLTNLGGRDENIEVTKRLGAADYLVKDETDPESIVTKINALLPKEEKS